MKKMAWILLLLSFIGNSSVIHASDSSRNRMDSIPDGTKNEVRNGEFTAEVNGLTLWFKVSGNGLVCLMPTPGWGPGSDIYFESLKEIEEIFTMVYIDTRGSGRSEKPDVEQYTIENFILDIEAIRSHIGVEQIWLMGHSKAGVIVLDYVLTFPENTKGIVLIKASVGH